VAGVSHRGHPLEQACCLWVRHGLEGRAFGWTRDLLNIENKSTY
jgi:hypothetical protein